MDTSNIPSLGHTAFSASAAPQARYILPQFEERTPYGFKRQDPYAKLFEDRIIFLGEEVNDATASLIVSQLLFLEAKDPDKDIQLYQGRYG